VSTHWVCSRSLGKTQRRDRSLPDPFLGAVGDGGLRTGVVTLRTVYLFVLRGFTSINISERTPGGDMGKDYG